jgi:hypothetical protein
MARTRRLTGLLQPRLGEDAADAHHQEADDVTEIGIAGADFLVDGHPTYEGRSFEGHRIEGLLFNVRAVQASFDDANPETRSLWAYPDTGEWDPERNVTEFCEALSTWKDHGVLGFTINFQGGGPYYEPTVYKAFDNNGFTPDGTLKPDYADRIGRILQRADELGMVPIVGIFYASHIVKLDDDEAMWRAADNALDFLASTGLRNLIVEYANEIEVIHKVTRNDLYAAGNAHFLIDRLRASHPEFIYTVSHAGASPESGRGIPSPELVEAVDFVCIHGNGCKEERLARAIDAVKAMPAYRARPKPILINEDSPAVENLDVSWRRGVSWGYYDQGFAGEGGWRGDAWVDFSARPRESRFAELSGFQTPPVNWTINTDYKRAFFNRVAEVTGTSTSESTGENERAITAP